MANNSATPPPSPAGEGGNRKAVRIQVGDHVDVSLGFSVSPKALVVLSSLAAAAGTWAYGFLHQ
jgi:hypothetical protein